MEIARLFPYFVVLLCLCPMTRATVTAVSIEQVDNSQGGAALNGFVTNDLSIDFAGRFGGAAIVLELTQGSIYQDTSFGVISTVPPSEALISLAPSIAFDTFLAQGGPTVESSLDDVALIGGRSISVPNPRSSLTNLGLT